MSYQVLARKWRPQTFADVVGQEHVLTALANGLSLGRIYHAYLFSDTHGIGKTSIVRLLAKELNCETDTTATPCGVCDNCREIEQGRFVDLIEIDAASRTKVEDTRDLLDNVQCAPARGRFKVYLIDRVHMLSRHSFNVLLKMLEEPSAHVKFLLVTTDPQKLPVTILSHCLQPHLKALDAEQIRHQLEHILGEEQIALKSRVLQLLSWAADGSLRDALSLTDQATASGEGQLAAASVSTILSTLDDDRAPLLIEALVAVDGERVVVGVNDVTARGVEWEALLVEIQSLLHRIAMVQLSPSALGADMVTAEVRMRELARTVPPGDVQPYYQALLVGRKELPYASDRQMGVEMTLLRVPAFHPRKPLPEPEVQPAQTVAPVPRQPVAPAAPPQQPSQSLSLTTSQVLAARSHLQRGQGTTTPKKSEPAAAPHVRPVNNAALEQLSSITECVQAHPVAAALEQVPAKEEAYRWKATIVVGEAKVEVTTPRALKKALEHEETPELAAKFAEEAVERDSWAAEVSRLTVPKLVEQVALNAWREQEGSRACLHLRPSQRHPNFIGAQQKLAEALGVLYGTPVGLIIVEDDNPAMRTPLEWRQAIYEGRLTQTRGTIIADNSVQTPRRFFDADLDGESTRPI